MQKLLHDFKVSLKYRAVVLKKLRVIDIDALVDGATMEVGHSPYAFEKITLWLKYQKNMGVDDIVEYLATFKGKHGGLDIHKNSWFRWATPNHKYQTSNIYHESWVVLCDAVNHLLAEEGRSIADFTFERTYTPNNLKAIREALGLDHNDFALVVGFTNGKIAKQLEESDPSANKRGAGFEDWANIIDRIKMAYVHKKKFTESEIVVSDAENEHDINSSEATETETYTV